MAEASRHARGLRRRAGGAQRRQVDPGQPAGGRQGRDRLAQGPDHAEPAARHPRAGRGPARLRRHARHLRRQAPLRARHGPRGLERRQRCRRHPAAGGCEARADARDQGDRREAQGDRPRDPGRAQQDRPGAAPQAAAARRRGAGDRPRGGDLHGVRARRRRRRRPAGRAQGADAARPLALSRRPAHRHIGAPAGGRDHARAALPAAAPGASLRGRGRDRRLERAAAAARSGSSR